MGHVADRWHLSKPGPDNTASCEHKGRVPSTAHGKGKRWQARYDGPDGRERTALFRTQAEAERYINKQEHDKQTGSWLDPRAGRVTVERFALEVWLPAQNAIERTATQYRKTLERYVFPEWGNREMRTVRPSEAAAWQQSLTSRHGLTGGTPHRVARVTRSLFRLAVIDRVIPVSPFASVKAPTVGETAVHPPDVAEVRRIIEHAYDERWRVLLELAALTGLRTGELRGLTLSAVDFLRRTVRVEQQLTYSRGEGLRLDRLKTAAARRTVPLPQRAVDVLAAYVKRHPPAAGGDWQGLIFTMPDGRPIQPGTMDHAIRSSCRRAGLVERSWHELRHHYASVLIAGGENPKVVQKRLGHANVTTTLTTYSHLFAEAEEQTRGVLDAAWESQAAGESSTQGGRFPESGGQVMPFPQVSGESG